MLNDTHLKVIRANAMGCFSKIFYGEYVSPLSQVSLVNCKKINSFRKITTLVWFLLMSIRSKNVLNSWKTLFIIIFFFSIDTSSFKAVIFILLVKNRTESKIRPKKHLLLYHIPPPPPTHTHTHIHTKKTTRNRRYQQTNTLFRDYAKPFGGGNIKIVFRAFHSLTIFAKRSILEV